MVDKMHKPRGPRVQLKVTKEIIETSKRADSRLCMTADGLKIARPDAKSIHVDIQTIRFTDPKRGLTYTYLTPTKVAQAILDFDYGHDVEPFECTLKNPQVTKARVRVAGLSEADKKARASLSKASLRDRGDGVVQRVGGKELPKPRPQYLRFNRVFGRGDLKGFMESGKKKS